MAVLTPDPTSPRTDTALKRWALASLVANMVIVWTGALVRLTKSGLGCPTWPRCDPSSYVPVPESGIHGLIEFGNRLLTFVLVAIAIGTAVTVWRVVREGRRPARMLWLAVAVGLGIIAQAVIGGISVLTRLNPWVVGLHMVASVALIMVTVELVHLAYGLPRIPTTGREATLARIVFWLGLAIVLLGVVVTGAGPNAGDGAATRSGLSLEWTAKIHAWAVWAEFALTLVGWVTARSNPRLRRLFAWVLAVELAQAAIGYWQYFTHVPLQLVLLHMVGTTLFVAAITHLFRLVARAPR